MFGSELASSPSILESTRSACDPTVSENRWCSASLRKQQKSTEPTIARGYVIYTLSLELDIKNKDLSELRWEAWLLNLHGSGHRTFQSGPQFVYRKPGHHDYIVIGKIIFTAHTTIAHKCSDSPSKYPVPCGD